MDLRYKRTEEFIRQAVLELGAKKDVYSLTVSEIAMKAKISRIAFYDHYDNAEALLEVMENEMIDDYIKQVGPYSDFLTDPLKIIRRVMNYYENQRYSPLVNSSRAANLTTKTVDRIIDEIMKASGNNSDSFRLKVTFAITGILGAFRSQCITNDNAMEDIARYVKLVLQ